MISGYRIKRAAVIGAGTMGSGIAGQLANAGVPCVLLDIVPPGAKDRSELATGAIKRLAKGRPPGFMDIANAGLVRPGNLEDDLDLLGGCDWIVEAVTEDLQVKRDLYRKLASVRRPGTVVSSNTSGLALNLLAEGLDDDFRRHFLITHFFNPPRYMYLLETVAGVDTAPEVMAEIESFCDVRLGKGIVRCKDTPNFIANRIGVHTMSASCRLMLEEGLSVEEVDAICGPPMGRPKTAAFRLQDLVGIDVSVMVMKNVKELLPNDESRDLFDPPDFLERLVREGKLGRKSGAGFYKKEKGEILVLDLDTWEYRPQKNVQFDSLAAAKKARSSGERLKTLISGEDSAARFAWRLLSETLLYSARRVPEIADDIVSIDRALRWGFNWDLGPFAAWDAIGVKAAADRLEAEGRELPALVKRVLGGKEKSFYSYVNKGGERRRAYFDVRSDSYLEVDPRPGVLQLDAIRDRSEPVQQNRAAAIWDLGGGVLGVEFRSKMNTISNDTLSAITDAIDMAEAGDYAGVVVGNQGAHFSLGADLVVFQEAVKDGKWDDIDAMIRKFHNTALRMRYAAKPVVVAVQGMVLGGGCELMMAGAEARAAAESYIGLVELGVGLIPGGGGTREMACRAHEAVPANVGGEFFPFLRSYFETIAQAKTSQSAAEARAFGYLRQNDTVSMNRDRLLQDAKLTVLHLAATGYRPPPPRNEVRVAGAPGLAELEVMLHQFHAAGYASDYDVELGRRFARALCGGEVDAEFPVTEQYLLDLERETFLSVAGEEKTQDRIAHTLKTGKPLRN